MFFKSALATALMAASAAEAHMIMTSPAPYGKDSLTNSPLAADGSDFPCKLRPDAFAPPDHPNEFAIGSTQKLSFIGSATHGGGSCQVSLTTDLQPSKESKWSVIKSFEGGCPANVEGNLGGGPNSPDPTTFNFTIPEGVNPGKYTLAWTWLNRIGNREFYMNCAPVTITGGGSSKREAEAEADLEKRSADFPPMFVANINGCTTKEDVDIRYPDPGKYVEYLGNPSNLAPEGPQCSGTPTFGGDGMNPGSGSPPPPPPSATATTLVPAPSGGGGGATSTSPVVVNPTDFPSSGSNDALTGSCGPDGDWNCISNTSFQRCASGLWTPAQKLTDGTVCDPGAGKQKRSPDLTPRYISAMRHVKRRVSHEWMHHA